MLLVNEIGIIESNMTTFYYLKGFPYAHAHVVTWRGHLI